MRLFLTVALLVSLTDYGVAQDFPTDPSHITSRSQEEVLEGQQSLGAAPSGNAPLLMALALDVIKDFEQWRQYAYNDASNYCTIGYGHLIAKKSCANCSFELKKFTQPLAFSDGNTLIDKDTTIARVNVKNLVHTQLSDEQFGALTSFVFNVGTQNFATSTMLKYLNNSEYEGALKEFPKWIKSKGVPLDGLVTRRACEALLFAGELSYRADHKFYRDDCATLGAAPSAETLIDIDIGEKR